MNYDAKIKEINEYLERAINAETKGNKDEAIKLYKIAYDKITELTKTLPDALKRKKQDQAAAILKIIESLDKDSVTTDKASEGKKILASLDISEPEIPDVTFNDVAGLNDVKNEIMSKIIYPMRYKELSEEYDINFGGGMLLFGPPGTGKTFIVKAIANEVKANFINVNQSSLSSKFFGEFEKNISSLFKAAYLLSPSIIFFDEIDSMVPRRDTSDSDASQRGVSQLLQEVGGLNSQKNKNVFIIAATNNPWKIDEAIMRPGRFDVKIYVPLPDYEARKKILELNLMKVKAVKDIDYDVLAKKTEHYSGADIEFICRKTRENSFMEAVKMGKKVYIETNDVLNVISGIKPSVDDALIKKYDDYLKTIK